MAQVVTRSDLPVIVTGVAEGCHRVMIAKLRERGVDQDKAEALTTERLADAVRLFEMRQVHHEAQRTRDQEADYSYSCAFSDLATWVEEIALV